METIGILRSWYCMTKATPHGGQESPSIPSNTATSAGRISNPCTAICPLMEFAATGKSKCKSLMVHDNTVEEDGQLGGPHGRPPRLHVLTSTSKTYATYDSKLGCISGKFSPIRSLAAPCMLRYQIHRSATASTRVSYSMILKPRSWQVP